MNIICFQLIKNPLLLRFVIIGMVMYFFFGCLESNIINVRRTPQGTFGCERGYNKITCPECSGSGQLQVMPWETMNRGKKSSVSQGLSFFSKDRSTSSGYKKCWNCAGNGFVCKKDNSNKQAKSKMSLSEENIRSRVYMAASNGHFVLIDKSDGPVGDVFYLAVRPISAEYGPANIPLDAIEYCLKEFVGLKKDYKFFNRFAQGCKKGLEMKGFAEIESIYNGEPLLISFIYHPRYKHLEVVVSQTGKSIKPKINTLDLKNIDVSKEKK